MAMVTDRRRALLGLRALLGWGAAGAGLAAAGTRADAAPAKTDAAPATREPWLGAGAADLRGLAERLAKAPRRRDFKSVPMILDDREQWDHEALAEVMAYKPAHKQVWDNTDIGSPWLNLMRNSLNAQVWSFKHPDFLVVSETHGSAHLALYDQATWDKYQLTKLAGDKFKTNTLIVAGEAASGDVADYENPHGVFSPADNSIPALMRRGAVFMACHNAIWEQAVKLTELGLDPERLGVERVAADLTNHLIEGVVLTPGAVATIPELQQVGFHYAYAK